MRFLSTRRRHPLAGLVVVLVGLILTGTAYAVAAPSAPSQSGSSQTEDLIEEGRQLYLVGCSSCHGKHAEGVVTASGNNYGPPLVGVGAAAVDFQVGTGRMPLAQPGAQAPEKDPVYTQEQIDALAAYIDSLGPGPDVPAKEQYDPSRVSQEDMVRGGQLWRSNCTACHNFNASGGAMPNGKFAPALADAKPKHMYEAMITGPQNMPVFSDDVLKPEDKRAIISYVQGLDRQGSPGGFSLGSLGPVSEGLFAWLVGIGALVAIAVWIGAMGVRAKK